MSGFMRKAALVVGAVALVAATAGAAAPLLAPGMAGAAGIAGVSAATLTAIGTYGGLAAGVLTAISTATAPGMSSQGSQTSFTTNPQSGLPYAMGRTRMSGLRIYANTNTRPGYTKFNDLLWFGALLSIGGAIGGIEKFTADNEIVTFDASGNAIGDYHDYQAQKIHLGGQQTSALALTLGGGAAPGWSTAHKLSGITHAMWCLRYNKQGEMYGAGAPEPAWIGNWVKVYDPRLDSTYPGGSGSCRALVESTYVWSDNPGLHALTWALGRWQNGKRTCGIGAPVANIRVAEFVECANVCEANGWKVGGVEWTTDSKWDTLKRILQAGGAQPTQTGAMIGCLVSTPRTAIATIESRHLLDSLSIAATKSRRDRFNSVIPRYVDEDSDWSVISGTAITVSDYVTADKGQRTKEIDYPLVQVFSGQVAKQPGQLAAYDIVNSREAGPINFTTGPEWIGLKTGDVVLLNVPEEGLSNQPILITRRAPDPSTGKVSFSAQTETYAKHPFALGQTTTPPPPFSLTAPDLKPPAPVESSWAASGTTTGEGLPAIVVIGESDMPSADAVVIDYRKAGDETWARSGIVSANAPVTHIISPLESETAYDIRVGYRVEQIDGAFLYLLAVTGAGKLSSIEDGATNGAIPGTNIFFPELPDIPMPPGLLRNDYVKLRSDGRLVYQPYGDPAVEEELGRISLPDIGALSASEGRRLDEASDRLAAAVLQAITDSDKNRVTLRDAGVYVDPATGQVRISAIDATAERVSEAYIRLDALRGEIVQRATVSYVDGQLAKLVIDPSQFPVFEGIELRVYNAEQRISGAEASINSKASALEVNAQGARLTDAELDIDAIEGKIDLKVDSTEFNALGLRVATAEQALEAIGDTASITQVVSVSRRLRTDIGDANEQILRTLLAGDAARRGQLDAMAQARQEITAKINDDNAAEARARQQLVVKVGAVEASALVETNLRIEGDRAVAQQVTDLSTAIGDQMAGFDERIITIVDDQDLISAGLTQTISAVRGVSGDADAAVEAALRGLLTGDKSGRDTASAIAAAREELTVKINQDAEAILQRVSALLVRMGGAEASILSMELLRATAELAIVARLNSLTASIGDNKAAIEREEIARTDAVSAQAGRIDTIVSRIGEEGAADSIEAKIEDAATTYVTDLEALAGRTETVESRIGAEGAEDSIEAKIAEAATTYAGPLEAQSEKIESVEARLGVEGQPGSIEAAIETASKTYVTDLQAQAERTDTIVARIGPEGDPDSIEAKIEDTREVLADVEGKLTSRVRIAATAGDTVYMELVADQYQGSRIVFGGDVFGDGIFTAKHFVANALIVPAYVYMNGPVNGPGWDSGDTGPGGVGGGTGGGGGSGGGQIP